MSAEEQEVFIIGPVVDETNAFILQCIAGTRILECERCSGPTFFAPSSLNRPEAKAAVFICMRCADKLAAESKTFEVATITDEQLQELHDAARRQR